MKAFSAPSNTLAFSAGRSGSDVEKTRYRRTRPKQSSDSLFAIVSPSESQRYQKLVNEFWKLKASTAESTDIVNTSSEGEVFFPRRGKKVDDDEPPRMRFAPSPTGRLVPHCTQSFIKISSTDESTF